MLLRYHHQKTELEKDYVASGPTCEEILIEVEESVSQSILLEQFQNVLSLED
jgi:hypothetical protein